MSLALASGFFTTSASPGATLDVVIKGSVGAGGDVMLWSPVLSGEYKEVSSTVLGTWLAINQWSLLF